MEPLIHLPYDTDPGLPSLVTPDPNHVLVMRGRDGATDAALRSMRSAGLLKNVRAVDLGLCDQITDAALNVLCDIESLTRLNVEGCWRITPRGFESLRSTPNLQTLDVSGCDGFDNQALATILGNSSLKILTMRKTPADVVGFMEWTPRARLRRLDIRGCRRIRKSDIPGIARKLHLGEHDIVHE